jgi:hypothetical protein
LFLPQVGLRGSVKHLFEEFQNSLGDRRKKSLELPHEIRESDHGRVNGIVRSVHERRKFLPDELESLREVLCELLLEESCAEWLGYRELTHPGSLTRVQPLSAFVREPDWTDAENIHKLRMYRAAAFVDCLRPNVLDWETPRIPDMEWVLEFIEVFTRLGISVEDQTNLIEDVSRPLISLEKIVQTERAPRTQLSLDDLRYVRDTAELSHEARAVAWDNRTPKPFRPFGRSNVEMYRDKNLAQNWRVAVNNQIKKAKKLFGSDSNQDEGEAN